MSEYIERTSEIILAANAGARAIENTKRYHGAFYTRDVFAANSAEIAYLQAAKVLRDIEDAPAADVAPVVRGRWEVCDYVEPDAHGFGTIRYENAGLKCTNCVHVFKRGSFWRINYCPNCGAKMDGGNENDV